jgi:hypothetical protein
MRAAKSALIQDASTFDPAMVDVDVESLNISFHQEISYQSWGSSSLKGLICFV